MLKIHLTSPVNRRILQAVSLHERKLWSELKLIFTDLLQNVNKRNLTPCRIEVNTFLQKYDQERTEIYSQKSKSNTPDFATWLKMQALKLCVSTELQTWINFNLSNFKRVNSLVEAKNVLQELEKCITTHRHALLLESW